MKMFGDRHLSTTEIENNFNHNNVEENPIPLPPRDRSKTLQPKSNLPRHQRKYPLIIPGGGLTRTLAKITTPPVQDVVDGTDCFLEEEGTEETGTEVIARKSSQSDVLGNG